MGNRWSGGQYSVVRAIWGVGLIVFFLLFGGSGGWDFSQTPLWSVPPRFHVLASVLFCAAAGLLIIGLWDRLAVWLLFFSTPWPTDDFWLSALWLPPLHFMYVVHFLTPPAPYGSWAARGRPDPAGGWRFPRLLYAVVWLYIAAAALAIGLKESLHPNFPVGAGLAEWLASYRESAPWLGRAIASWPTPALAAVSWVMLGLKLGFAPTALFARLRPAAWFALLLAYGLLGSVFFLPSGVALAFTLMFAFNPAWASPPATQPPILIFFDGDCGLCHRAVRFAFAEDVDGRFRAAPLGGETFRAKIAAERRKGLPDSVVVIEEGRLLTESRAALAILANLGGLWRVAARLMRWVPKAWADAVYRGVARVRKRIFAAPKSSCPIMPPHFRDRFLP